ncbi:MAG: 1,4-alpha-glucan branching protein GlgB [Pseudomonadota bacterium]
MHDASQIEAVVAGRHADPFGFLGPHSHADSVIIRTFQPGAEAVDVVDGKSAKRLATLDRLSDEGFFAGEISSRSLPLAYRLHVRWPGGEATVEDPFRFPPVLGDIDAHLWGEGRYLEAYDRFGAHPMAMEGIDGASFAVWAPNAQRVSVVGDFNGWDGRLHPMRLRHGIGVWEAFIPGVGPGVRYKYEIVGPDGNLAPLKADPFGFAAEHPPATASVVAARLDRAWSDGDWMQKRGAANALDAPISIYEVHLGSWRRGPDNRYLTYEEFARDLVDYANFMGFTHIQLMPVNEYPFDGSWGYQPVGLYAPTSRFGPPEAFQAFVEAAHRADLGVLIDWVPGHFPTDAHGLGGFDGTQLYEHADTRKGFHPDWNTLIYNYGRREVSNFLVGNALFWLDKYHIDGLRVDAVASMLYLDYSRKEGEWVPNSFGGRENLEAIDFLREMNTEAFGKFDGVTTIAEESTSWPGVSRPVYTGGLGFGFKWNMGWMHDTLEYMSHDPIHRRYHHNEMTFGLLYAFSENFVLPLSHDEVVHGKGSLLSKMPGDDWQKFANLRAYFGFMWTHPGKKLLFMGGEFGQWAEWNHNFSLDWHLVEQDYGADWRPHAGLQMLVRDLNRVYRDTPALHQLDCDAEGFQWIEGGDVDQSVFAFQRSGRDGAKPVIAISNFTPVPRTDYRVGVPVGGRWTEMLNTDAVLYGGGGLGNFGGVEADEAGWHGQPYSLSLTLPPLATVILGAP